MNPTKFPMKKLASDNLSVNSTYNYGTSQELNETKTSFGEKHPNKLESLSKYLMLKFLTVITTLTFFIF